MNGLIKCFREDLAIKRIHFKVLSTVIAAVALLMPATGVYAAQDSPLEKLGMLTFETGAADGSPDKFVYYPPDGAAPKVQLVTDEPKNKCVLDESAEATGRDDLEWPDGPTRDLLVDLEQMGGGVNVGVVGSDQLRSSVGIHSKGGGGGSASGVKCGRINGPEILSIAPGAHHDRDMDGEPNVVVVNARMDWEFKGSPVLLFTAISGYDEDGDPISEKFFVASGINSAVNVSGFTRLREEIDGITQQCSQLIKQDVNNDAGSADNCMITLQKVMVAEPGEEAGVVIEEIHWRELHVQVHQSYGGSVSFEGGGDWAFPSVNRSEFDLVRVDANIGCQSATNTEGLSTTSGTPGSSGFIRAVRLNGGCAEQTFLATSIDLIVNSWKLLWSQNADVSVNLAAYVEWDTEALGDASTRVTWDHVPDEDLVPDANGDNFWSLCKEFPLFVPLGEPRTARCFVLEECEGTPLRFCGAKKDLDPDTQLPLYACVTDADCSGSTAGESCVLTELLEPLGDPDADPEIPPGLRDMDATYTDSNGDVVPGIDGDQHMCFLDKHLTVIGTSGLNGILETSPDDEEPQGDDTADDRHFVQEVIFIKGDARGGRQ